MGRSVRVRARWRPRDFSYPLLLGLGGLDATGYSLIAPVAPTIAQTVGAGPGTIGVLVASFPAGMVVGFAVAGAILRTRGPRWLIVGALGVVAAGALGFVVADSLTEFLLSRFTMGIGSGGIWIGVTFDTLERWPGQEYLCMSRVFAAYSVGGLVGPALGALGGVDAPFLAYLAFVLVAIIGVGLVRAPLERRSFSTDWTPLRSRAFWTASAAILFAVAALGVLEGVLPLHFSLRLDQAELGALYVAASLAVTIAAASVGGRRPRPLVVGAAVLVTVGLGLAGATTQVGIWPAAILLAALGIGLANTGSLGLLFEAVPADRIVTAMIVWSQIGILGYLIGPLFGGFVAASAGYAYIALIPAVTGAAALALLLPSPPGEPSAG